MEHKVFPFEVTDIDYEGRMLEGYASVFNVRDQGDDVVHRGAFRKTLMERGDKVKFLWQHDATEPIGRPLVLREDNHGLFVKAIVSKTRRGEDAIQLLQDGAIDGLSIGYDAIKGGTDYSEDAEGNRIRNLKELKLYEFSLVTFSMNEQAQVTALKADAAPAESKPAPDVTENTIRIRVRDPGDFQEGSFRTISIDADRGIQAVVGKLEGETTTVVQSYIFAKDRWDVADAQAWVDEHEKEKQSSPPVPPEHETITCECAACGRREESLVPCAGLKCPECGGEMGLAEKAGGEEESMEEKGITDQDKAVLKRELRGMNMTDVVATHRRLHNMAAQGNTLTGFGRADMNWFHAAVEAELRRRAVADEREPAEATPLEWRKEGEEPAEEAGAPGDEDEKHMPGRIAVIRDREKGKALAWADVEAKMREYYAAAGVKEPTDADVQAAVLYAFEAVGEGKVGRVLAARNAARIGAALASLIEVLEDAGVDVPGSRRETPEEEEEPEEEEGKNADIDFSATGAVPLEQMAGRVTVTVTDAGGYEVSLSDLVEFVKERTATVAVAEQAAVGETEAGPDEVPPTSEWMRQAAKGLLELQLMEVEDELERGKRRG